MLPNVILKVTIRTIQEQRGKEEMPKKPEEEAVLKKSKPKFGQGDRYGNWARTDEGGNILFHP